MIPRRRVTALVAVALTAGCVGAPRTGAQEVDVGLIETEPGVRLYREVRGEGESTLLVPNAVFLERDLARLAAGRRVVFYDLRQRGRSLPVEDRASLSRGVWHDIEDIEAVRRHVGGERVSLLGHSYLGVAAALYAMEHPERVERLVLIGPSPPRWGTPYPPELSAASAPEPVSAERLAALGGGRGSNDPAAHCREWHEVMSRFLMGDPERYREILQDWCRYPNEWPVNVERHLVEDVVPSLERLSLDESRLAKARMPVLVVHGTWDRNAPYGGGREWATRLPNARLLSVPRAGHVPWIEAPRVVAQIDAFLEGTWPDGAETVSPR